VPIGEYTPNRASHLLASNIQPLQSRKTSSEQTDL